MVSPGSLVAPGDPDALAESLLALLRSPERRQALGRAARARVLPTFAASRLVADVDALYGELLRAKGVAVPW